MTQIPSKVVIFIAELADEVEEVLIAFLREEKGKLRGFSLVGPKDCMRLVRIAIKGIIHL